MSPIVLGPQGLPTSSSLQAVLPDGQTLLVLSGIAEPDWVVNDDGHIYYQDIQVRLGVFALTIQQATITVGLASVANGDSAFTLALNTGTLSLDPNTGELLLDVAAAALGNQTAVSRFGYQVVTTVDRVMPKITGDVGWPSSLWAAGDVQAVNAQLHIVASIVVPPSGPQQFGTTEPIAAAELTTVSRQSDGYIVASFEIDDVPLYRPLAVSVTPGADFKPPAGEYLTVIQTGGPTEFTLTQSTPAEQVIFAIQSVTLG